MDRFRFIMEIIGYIMDGVGVVVIAVGAVAGAARLLVTRGENSYYAYRQDLGRAILLGLEFLVAGDIIRTVVVNPSLENVAVLALIVLIRTFLSITLEVELDGTLPWRRHGGG